MYCALNIWHHRADRGRIDLLETIGILHAVSGCAERSDECTRNRRTSEALEMRPGSEDVWCNAEAPTTSIVPCIEKEVHTAIRLPNQGMINPSPKILAVAGLRMVVRLV